MIAEMLPFEDAINHPNGKFSPGAGFESSNCDFWVYGPEENPNDFYSEWQRLASEGYCLYFTRRDGKVDYKG